MNFVEQLNRELQFFLKKLQPYVRKSATMKPFVKIIPTVHTKCIIFLLVV
jgi:hypothetical protein